MAGLSVGTRARAAGRALVGIFSENSAKQAWNILGGILPGGVGTPPTRGTAEYLRAYSEMPWLRAIAGRISTAVAQSEWQLYVLKGKQSKKAIGGGVVRRIQRCATHKQRMALLKSAVQVDDLVQIDEHPLLDVLSNANEFQTGLAMRKVTQLHLDLVGDAFWLKERDGQGTVIAVWPVPPHWIMATPTPTFRFFRVSFKAWRGLIPDTEFTWFSDDDPFNPYARGTGIARSLADELETDEYAAKMSKAYFYNSARPDLLVWPKGQGMQPSESKRLEEDWLSKSSGFWRAFRPYFLSREVEVKELSSMGNFRALQLTQIREAERNIVMQTFGIPPEILGNIENSNRSTIDAAAYLMSRYVVEPRLEFMRSVLQERMIPEFDDRLIIDFTSPVQDDHAQQLQAATSSSWSLSMDEWRKLSGLPPMEDKDAGALHMVPTLAKPMTIEQMLEPPAPPPPMIIGGGPGAPGVIDSPAAPPKPPAPPARAIALRGIGSGLYAVDIDAAMDAGDVGLATELTKAQTLDVEGLPPASAVGARQEPQLARALLRVWRDHAARVNLTALERALGPTGTLGDVMAALRLDVMAAAQTAALVPLVQRSFRIGAEVGGQALRRHGIPVKSAAGLAEVAMGAESTPLSAKGEPQHPAAHKAPQVAIDLASINPEAVKWAEERAASLVDLPTAAQARIRALIAQAVADKISDASLARELRAIVGLTDQQAAAVSSFSQRVWSDQSISASVAESRVARYASAQLRSRANAIARTETMSSLNRGQQALWSKAAEQGSIAKDQFEQVWIITPDDALCPECEAMDGETAEIDGTFSDGTDGPPGHTNCRCAVGLQTKY